MLLLKRSQLSCNDDISHHCLDSISKVYIVWGLLHRECNNAQRTDQRSEQPMSELLTSDIAISGANITQENTDVKAESQGSGSSVKDKMQT